jgi:hypothetical protein
VLCAVARIAAEGARELAAITAGLSSWSSPTNRLRNPEKGRPYVSVVLAKVETP